MNGTQLSAHAVILAGGRGTRFWPRSRTRTPKQLLNIAGKRTMLEQTVARLAPIFLPSRIWTVTSAEQFSEVRRQLPAESRKQVLAEPVGRNTAAAIGLAAIHIRHQVLRNAKTRALDAVMAVFPADHYIAKEARFQTIVRAALDTAVPGKLVVLGIPPTRPETGFGYIERAPGKVALMRGVPVYAVRRFTEKPERRRALQYVKSGQYHWNAGMFFWRLSTFFESLEKFLPKTFATLTTIAETIGTSRYERALKLGYRELSSISIDYAIMEPATRQKTRGNPVFVLPADVSWSDIGSWAAVYELLAKSPLDNVSAGDLLALDAQGNYFWSPGKLVAAIGVRNVVVVDTPDAILICPRDRAQDVGKIVKLLEERRRADLL